MMRRNPYHGTARLTTDDVDVRGIHRPACHPASVFVENRTLFDFDRGDTVARRFRFPMLECAACQRELADYVRSLRIKTGDEMKTPAGVGIVDEVTAYRWPAPRGWDEPTAVVGVLVKDKKGLVHHIVAVPKERL